ncbi:hypothetical protein [Planococcus rifietoensis]|uniref:hypothetical protein n=1 Tax=Planococcus rifietoensis TaxID=200991 RepID=UPI00384A8E23
MNIDYYEALIPPIVDSFSALATVLLPLFLWILIPAIILKLIFRNRVFWNLGCLLGLIGYFTIGPFFNYNFF